MRQADRWPDQARLGGGQYRAYGTLSGSANRLRPQVSSRIVPRLERIRWTRWRLNTPATPGSLLAILGII